MDSDSYLENFKKLKQIAATLRNQQEIDIDSLIPMIEEATAAYRACKARIEAVKAMFEEKVSGLD